MAEVEQSTPSHFDHIMKSGFTMNDIKGLNRNYAEDAAEADEHMMRSSGPSRPPRKGSLSRPGPAYDPPSLTVNGQMQRSTSALDMNQYDQEGDDKKKRGRGRSPFRFFKKRDQSKDKVKSRSPDAMDRNTLTQGRNVVQSSLMTRAPTVRVSNADLRVQAPNIPDRPKTMTMNALGSQNIETSGNEVYDGECLKLINEYFYGVRIYPGQDPTHVYVGWVTTQYHLHSKDFTQDKVRRSAIILEDDYDQIMGCVNRQSCYMVRADELFNEVTQDASGKGASQGMFVGCFVDTATGTIRFTCEGKETSHRWQMEPDTKLFPAIFVEATSKEILQIELGRTPTTLPLSAAVLPTSDKHINPQFPPRLKVQCLKPHQWARVPNTALQVHALKLSDIRGWSLLCEDPISMLALHIPEEDRCMDVLELIEMDKLLSFHSHTLTLYAALCYQSNYRAAHALCLHVDQKQLLYAIKSEYMSGPLRQGFCDLLIALHLESHATTMYVFLYLIKMKVFLIFAIINYSREVCKNEFIIPLGTELRDLYTNGEMGHSLRSQLTESVRPTMKMTEIA